MPAPLNDCKRNMATIKPEILYTGGHQWSDQHCMIQYRTGHAGDHPLLGKVIYDTINAILDKCKEHHGSFGTGNCDTCGVTVNYRNPNHFNSHHSGWPCWHGCKRNSNISESWNATTQWNARAPLNATVPLNATTRFNATALWNATASPNGTAPLNGTSLGNGTAPLNATASWNTTAPAYWSMQRASRVNLH